MKARIATAALAVGLLLVPALATAQDLPAGKTNMIDDPCAGRAADLYDPAADWPWLCRYHAANLALAGKPVDTVFLGDSITEGWGYADPSLFTQTVINRGISGQTSPQLVLRFMADVVALEPKVVHLMIGTNDIAGNTGPSSPAAYQNNIRAMAAMARANGIAVVIGSIPPADHMSWRPGLAPAARIAQLNAWLKAYAAEQHFVFADYHGALAGPGGELPAKFGPDGVHPNAAGYAVMRPIALAAIAEAAAQASSPRPLP